MAPLAALPPPPVADQWSGKAQNPGTPTDSQKPEALGDLAAHCRYFLRRSRAANTIRAYRSDWLDFHGWCAMHGFAHMPAEPGTVAMYLTSLADRGYTVSTIQRRTTTIAQAHQAAGFESPTRAAVVRTLMSGIRRERGTRQNGKAPLLTADIRKVSSLLPDSCAGIRDRALILLGYAGGFRRSELVSLDWEDVEFNSEGLVITLRRSKTDQDGEGRRIGIPYGSNPRTCPVRSLAAWREALSGTTGPVFRGVNWKGQPRSTRLCDKAVALVVKRAAEAAGLDPVNYAGHSLRAGLATQAAANGASERLIMRQTGHRSLNTVRRYIREGSLFRENAAFHLGL